MRKTYHFEHNSSAVGGKSMIKSIKNHYVYNVSQNPMRGVNETLINLVIYDVFWRHFRGGVKTLIEPVVYEDFFDTFAHEENGFPKKLSKGFLKDVSSFWPNTFFKKVSQNSSKP